MKKNSEEIQTTKLLPSVCSGIAKYLDTDPVIIRLIWALADLLIWNRFSFLHHLLDYYPRRRSKW
ncbi:MAG: PspC domain-containing protein [Streptococcus salivarius]